MNPQLQLRPAHTLVLRTVLLYACISALTTVARAQDTACSFNHIQERVPPTYPATLNGQNIQGTLTLAATVTPEGRIASSKIISGPPQLRFSAQAYVNGWHVDPSPAQRQCLITLDYRFDGSQGICEKLADTTVQPERLDDTHVLLHLHCDVW